MAAKTLEEFFREYRSGFNPVTGEQNLFKDLTDQHVWDAAIKSVEENGNSLQQLKAEIAAVANTIIECEAGGVTVDFAALKRHLLRLSAV